MGDSTAGPSARVSWRARSIVAPAESSTRLRHAVGPDPRAPLGESAFMRDVVRGLSRTPKSIPAKYMFDALGARLFACLGTLAEHRVAHAELRLLAEHGPAITDAVGERVTLVDPACGDGARVAILARHLRRPLEIVLADRAPGSADDAARTVRAQAPLSPVLALGRLDPWDVSAPRGGGQVVVTLGRGLTGEVDAEVLEGHLRRLRDRVGLAPRLLVAIDLEGSPADLEATYDDRAGVAASFNLNLLARVNRELGGTFPLAAYEHRAVHVAERGCVELRLVSKRAHWASVGQEWFTLSAGEPIVTKVAHQYSLASFTSIAEGAGWRTDRVFVDGAGSCALFFLGT